MEISLDKTKIMAFVGKDHKRSKICIENRSLEQVSTFKYLGYHLSYISEDDIQHKITNYIKVTGL
jgi:hypothetical protein